MGGANPPARAARPRVLPAEVELTAIRAQGAGGQNVNKVASAVHLRFDIGASSLPEAVQQRLRSLPDARIGADGVLVLKAQTHRTYGRNRADALARLQALVDRAAAPPPPPRVATQPSRSAKRRRLDDKARRGQLKAARRARGE